MSASNQIISQQTSVSDEVFEKVMLGQDLKGLKPLEKVQYINGLCSSLGLNPLTKPFEIMSFQGKEIPYARKDCTEQLRSIRKVSISRLEKEMMEGGIYIVTAYANLPDGRQDSSTGVVTVTGLKGDALANAYMKCETKAKRRVTLSICGLGMLDESELDTMQGAVKVSVVQPINKVIEQVQTVQIEKARDIDMDCMDIAWAEDKVKLQEIFTVAYKYWVGLKDKENLERLLIAKDKRKSELEIDVEVSDENTL